MIWAVNRDAAQPDPTATLPLSAFDRWVDGVAVFDLEGRYLYVNDAAEQLAGLPRAQLLDARIWDLYPDIVGNPLWRAFEALREGAPAQRIEIPYPTWGRVFQSELTSIDGGRVFAIWRDVTAARAAALAEGQRRADVADAAARFADLFDAVLAHDLRSPLSAIMMSVTNLRRKITDEGLRRSVDRIQRSSDRLLRMLDQLLDFTRIHIGDGLTLAPRLVSLGDLCQSAIESLGAPPDSKITFVPRGSSTGTWDAERLGQALKILLGNALQHGAPGQPLTLTLDGSAPEEVRLVLHNHGAIPPTELPGILAPFRASTSSDKARGLGLGLFITAHIARLHGGRLEVASDETEGTTFTLTLPRHPPAA